MLSTLISLYKLLGTGDFVKVLLILLSFQLMQSRPSHCGNRTALPAFSFLPSPLYFLKNMP